MKLGPYLALVALSLSLLLTARVGADLPDLETLYGPPPTPPSNWPAGDGAPTDPASTSYTQGSPSRLALYVPGDTYKQYPGWLVLYKMLLIIGIPTFVTKDLSVATQSKVMLAYQVLNGTVDSATSTALDTYVRGGKTLIATSFNTSDATLTALFGIQVDTQDQNDNTTVRGYIGLQPNNVSQAAYNVMNGFDYTDTRDTWIKIWMDDLDAALPSIGYNATTNSTVQTLATYIDFELNNSTGVTAISLMSYSTGGMACAVGLDVGAYIGLSNGGRTNGIPRSYAAQYEPGYDTFLRLFKAIYIQAGGGVTTWPVKNNMGVYFAWTYDIDASDSWAGAVTVSKSLANFKIKGTINWQTKTVKDAYDKEFFTLYRGNISLAEAVGNGMEMSSHSVSHTPNLVNLTVGTGNELFTGPRFDETNYWPYIGQCDNTTLPGGNWTNFIPNTTYCDTPNEILYFYTTVESTLFGEARVSKYLVEAHSSQGATVESFRTGHLLFPDAIGQVIERVGYKYSSIGSSNDQNTHLPFQLMYNKGYNQEIDIIEASMTSSDGDTGEPDISNVWALPGDLTYPNGSALYRQFTLLQKLKRYGASYTFLLHPTDFGVGIPWATNKLLFKDKLAFQEAFIPLISNISYFDTVAGRGYFTKTRMQTAIDWTTNGPLVNITIKNPAPIELLTLNVPTTWTIVSATTPVSPFAGGVIILGSIPPGTYNIVYTTASYNQPFVITGEVPHATSTIPAPSIQTRAATPTPSVFKIIDDFSDPPRYSNQTNALGFYTSDDHTMAERATVQGDWLFLNFTTRSYWYTLLGDVGHCNDYSQMQRLEIALRFPTGVPVAFDMNLPDLDIQTCNQSTDHLINIGGPGSAFSLQASTDWQHLRIPLSSFGANTLNLVSIQIKNFTSNGAVEIDYIQMATAAPSRRNPTAVALSLLAVVVAVLLNL